MAKDRIEPCLYYVCNGECSKGRSANYSSYCQKCDKYVPRTKMKHLNQKKQKLQKIRESEKYYD